MNAGFALKLNGAMGLVLQSGRLLTVLCYCSNLLANVFGHSWLGMETVLHIGAGLLSWLSGQMQSQVMFPHFPDPLAELPAWVRPQAVFSNKAGFFF